jgi:hypothetical protein
MLKQPPPLVRRHAIELCQPVLHSLLRLRGKIPKTGLIRKRPLLIGKRQVAMTIHPLGQMLQLLPLPGPRGSQSRMPLKSPSARPSRLSSSHTHTQTQQQQASKRWLETTPEFGWKSHDIQTVRTCMSLVTKT